MHVVKGLGFAFLTMLLTSLETMCLAEKSHAPLDTPTETPADTTTGSGALQQSAAQTLVLQYVF